MDAVGGQLSNSLEEEGVVLELRKLLLRLEILLAADHVQDDAPQGQPAALFVGQKAHLLDSLKAGYFIRPP